MESSKVHKNAIVNSNKNSRSIRSEDKYLITILLDHASPNSFFNMVDEGAAPHVSKYILGRKNPENNTYSNASISRNIITGFPSTSANTHTSILTGSYGGKNNLSLGNYWNLLGKKPKFIETSKISFNGIKKFNMDYVNRDTKMLFEYFSDSASFHIPNRGATYKEFTLFSLFVNYLPLFFQLKNKNEPGHVSPIAQPELWKNICHSILERFLKRVKRKSLPKANFIVFLLTDENAHRYGFNSKQYKEAIQILDFYVQGIVEGFDYRGKHIDGLEQLGYADKVIWNIHTDHAGRPIQRDKFVTINRLLEVDLGLKIIEGAHDRISKKVMKQFTKKYNEINAYGSTSSELWSGWFSKHNENGLKPIDFTKFYGESFFRELIPKNSEIRERSDKIDMIDYLINQDHVQFVIIPEEKDITVDLSKSNKLKRTEMVIPRDYSIKIFDKTGSSKIDRRFNEETKLIEYKYIVIDGNDPLKYENLGLNSGTWNDQMKCLEKTLNHQLPDVFHRLFGYFDCIFASNIVITSKFDYHYWKVNENHGRQMLKHQSHDGLFKEESVVPLTFAGPGIKKGYEIPQGRNIDVLPTLLKAVGIDYDTKIMDGNALDEILEQ